MNVVNADSPTKEFRIAHIVQWMNPMCRWRINWILVMNIIQLLPNPDALTRHMHTPMSFKWLIQFSRIQLFFSQWRHLRAALSPINQLSADANLWSAEVIRRIWKRMMIRQPSHLRIPLTKSINFIYSSLILCDCNFRQQLRWPLRCPISFLIMTEYVAVPISHLHFMGEIKPRFNSILKSTDDWKSLRDGRSSKSKYNKSKQWKKNHKVVRTMISPRIRLPILSITYCDERFICATNAMVTKLSHQNSYHKVVWHKVGPNSDIVTGTACVGSPMPIFISAYTRKL